MIYKIALAPCNGMSPNGLVSRVACGDCRKQNENIISICMGSTSADIEGLNNEMLKRFPIIAVNGCSGMCVNKILKSKEIDVVDTIPVFEILKDACLVATDAFRLSEVEEECVKVITEEINKRVEKIQTNQE